MNCNSGCWYSVMLLFAKISFGRIIATVFLLALFVSRIVGQELNQVNGRTSVGQSHGIVDTTFKEQPDNFAVLQIDGTSASSRPIVMVNYDFPRWKFTLFAEVAAHRSSGGYRLYHAQRKAREGDFSAFFLGSDIETDRQGFYFCLLVDKRIDNKVAFRQIQIFAEDTFLYPKPTKKYVGFPFLPSRLRIVDSRNFARQYSWWRRQEQAVCNMSSSQESPGRINEETASFDGCYGCWFAVGGLMEAHNSDGGKFYFFYSANERVFSSGFANWTKDETIAIAILAFMILGASLCLQTLKGIVKLILPALWLVIVVIISERAISADCPR